MLKEMLMSEIIKLKDIKINILSSNNQKLITIVSPQDLKPKLNFLYSQYIKEYSGSISSIPVNDRYRCYIEILDTKNIIQQKYEVLIEKSKIEMLSTLTKKYDIEHVSNTQNSSLEKFCRIKKIELKYFLQAPYIKYGNFFYRVYIEYISKTDLLSIYIDVSNYKIISHRDMV